MSQQVFCSENKVGALVPQWWQRQWGLLLLWFFKNFAHIFGVLVKVMVEVRRCFPAVRKLLADSQQIVAGEEGRSYEEREDECSLWAEKNRKESE